MNDLAYIDPESLLDPDQESRVTLVSGYMAGKAFNDLCKMIGGRWPDAKMQEEAPIAYEFFMKLFGVEIG